MLKRTLATAFVAMLALAFAGDGSAEPQKPAQQKPPPQQKPPQDMSDLHQNLQSKLNEANNPTRSSPKPPRPRHGQSAGQKGILSGGLLDGHGGFNQNAAAPMGAAAPAARNSAGQVIK
jgi:hypothetical protein